MTSLGFQKVALEHELSQYKDKTKSLVEKLNAQASDMEKSEKNKQEVNRKLGVVRKALTKQLEEVHDCVIWSVSSHKFVRRFQISSCTTL